MLGTCPSSTATMKMGIERVLKTNFGDQLIEVIQVDAQDTSASVEAVNEQLNVLRPAIEGYHLCSHFPCKIVFR